MTIKEFIKSRRTIRKFNQTPINGEQLSEYVDAARVAPSGANLQPLKYITICSKEMNDKIFPLVKWAGYLAPNYNPKENERPTAYIAVCADTSIRKNGYDIDVGAAVENIILSALEDGVGSCWMKAIDYTKISKLLDLSENLELSCIIALGYPSEEPMEVEMNDGDVEYFLDDNGILCVPKRDLDEIIINKY